MVTYLSIIRGIEVPVSFVGSGRCGRMLQWSGVVAVWHSKLPRWPPQVCCVEDLFPLWCWFVRRASGSDGVVRLSLIEKKTTVKSMMFWLITGG